MQLALIYDQTRDSWARRHNGYLFVLSKKFHAQINSAEREYMIVARLGKHPKGFIIEPVDDTRHVLVDHSGFECSGSMCRTTAWISEVSAELLGCKRMITPGRVSNIVRVIDNVNQNWSFPIYDQAELDNIKANPLFKEENLKLNTERAEGSCLAWYKWGYREPVRGSCYLEVGDTRACGLPDVNQLGNGTP